MEICTYKHTARIEVRYAATRDYSPELQPPIYCHVGSLLACMAAWRRCRALHQGAKRPRTLARQVAQDGELQQSGWRH